MLITLRDRDEGHLLARLHTLLAGYPVPAPPSPPASQGEGWCQVHGLQMKWNAGKDGKPGWWSHRTQDGWCKGK